MHDARQPELCRGAGLRKQQKARISCLIRAFLYGVELTGKPGSVVDSHSSRPAIARWLKQPTRVQYGPYHVNPYLALLRVEFTVP